ncbi:MAG TPA: zf-HC2 domain-containing protein [Chthoniobacterales bacterium]
MNCDQARSSLDAYVDDELDLPSQLEMEEHLQGCGACQKEVKKMSKFKTLVRFNMPAYEAPPELRSIILRDAAEEIQAPLQMDIYIRTTTRLCGRLRRLRFRDLFDLAFRLGAQ